MRKTKKQRKNIKKDNMKMKKYYPKLSVKPCIYTDEDGLEHIVHFRIKYGSVHTNYCCKKPRIVAIVKQNRKCFYAHFRKYCYEIAKSLTENDKDFEKMYNQLLKHKLSPKSILMYAVINDSLKKEKTKYVNN